MLALCLHTWWHHAVDKTQVSLGSALCVPCSWGGSSCIAGAAGTWRRKGGREGQCTAPQMSCVFARVCVAAGDRQRHREWWLAGLGLTEVCRGISHCLLISWPRIFLWQLNSSLFLFSSWQQVGGNLCFHGVLRCEWLRPSSSNRPPSRSSILIYLMMFGSLVSSFSGGHWYSSPWRESAGIALGSGVTSRLQCDLLVGGVWPGAPTHHCKVGNHLWSPVPP